MARQASVHNVPGAAADRPPSPTTPTEDGPAAQKEAAGAAEPALAPASRAGLRSTAGARRGAPRAGAAAAKQQQQQQAAAAAAELPAAAEPRAAAKPAARPAAGGRKAGAATPARPLARHPPKTPDAATPAVRTGGRRVVVSWNSEAVTDPRSGKVVYRVDPGTFCTQCFATHTPVWRAGPFGHKTLCNACGERPAQALVCSGCSGFAEHSSHGG